MKAFIIAGGFGTRMRPLTDAVPKSLLPVLNKPFLEHQLEQLAAVDVTETYLLTGYLAEDFATFAKHMKTRGITVHVSTEETPLDTAGAVRQVLDTMDGTALVLNGDAVIAGLDWRAAIDAHTASGAAATLVLVHLDDATGYGLVRYDEESWVTEFTQLSMNDTDSRGWINAGNYVLEPRALAHVPADTRWSFEKQVFPELAKAHELRAHPSDGFWLDFGTPQRYLEGHFDVLSGRARLNVEGELLTESKRFEDGTALEAPVLLSHAPVGKGAMLGPLTTLGPRAKVGAGARIERSVIHEDAVIGEGAVVRGSIIGRGAEVNAGTELTDTVIA
ncbi:MAG: sugar phosphate nucleotidyltransferase [Actinomycetota bacterium]